jgi:hypothetical protein
MDAVDLTQISMDPCRPIDLIGGRMVMADLLRELRILPSSA